jgi:hypothetical protein
MTTNLSVSKIKNQSTKKISNGIKNRADLYELDNQKIEFMHE